MENAAPNIDWDWIHDQMSNCPWSEPAREAGIWAIETLREQLGPRWPKAWAAPGTAPAGLVFAGSMLSGLASTLGLALALSELRSIDGIAPLRAAIRQTARADALASPRLQLRVAAVAVSLKMEVKLEPLLHYGETRADLLIRSEGVSIGAEALAVLRDQRSVDADKWLAPFNIELIQIGQRHGVDFNGAIDTPLDEIETAALLAEAERWAAAVAGGLAMPDLRKGGVTLGVVPGDGPGGKINFRYPVVAFDRRLQNKLADKAEQTRRSGADWLLIDSLDHLWHLTAWSQMGLGEKAQALAGLIRTSLALSSPMGQHSGGLRRKSRRSRSPTTHLRFRAVSTMETSARASLYLCKVWVWRQLKSGAKCWTRRMAGSVRLSSGSVSCRPLS